MSSCLCMGHRCRSRGSEYEHEVEIRAVMSASCCPLQPSLWVPRISGSFILTRREFQHAAAVLTCHPVSSGVLAVSHRSLTLPGTASPPLPARFSSSARFGTEGGRQAAPRPGLPQATPSTCDGWTREVFCGEYFPNFPKNQVLMS